MTKIELAKLRIRQAMKRKGIKASWTSRKEINLLAKTLCELKTYHELQTHKWR